MNIFTTYDIFIKILDLEALFRLNTPIVAETTKKKNRCSWRFALRCIAVNLRIVLGKMNALLHGSR